MEARMARELLEGERERLVRLRDGLAAEHADLAVEGGAPVELSPIDQHQADVGSEMFEQEKGRSILGSVDADLRDVLDALDRLAAGTYGRCLTCGDAIPDERLEAVPATRFCLSHEVLWEGTQMTWSVPAGVGLDDVPVAERYAGREAARHLEFLPNDDEWGEELDLSPEELALHASDDTGNHLGALAHGDVAMAGSREPEAEVGAGDDDLGGARRR